VCVERDFGQSQPDFVEQSANIFALELLMPGFLVKFVIVKRNVGTVEKLTEMFDVSTEALIHKLRRLGWVPWTIDWDRGWKREKAKFERYQRKIEALERQWNRMMLRS
jgi:Zn-dependent peptidase ImmA (M78 family)